MNEFSFQKSAHLMGRFDCSNPEEPVAGWVNSAIFVRFHGTDIRMTACGSGDKDYVEIVLDGVARNWIRIEKGVNEYVLEEGLPDTDHVIEVQKRTTILYGAITFKGFTLSKGGSFLEPPKCKKIKLEYLGDSITSGCGIGCPHELSDAPQLDDGYMSYVGISARLLDAEYHNISIPGVGVVQDALGGVNNLPSQFHGTIGADSATWDFSSYIADAVIINLGQNDYSTPIDDEKYSSAYIRFVGEVLEQYPNAYIFCCVGTMSNRCLAGVKKVVSYFNERGNKKVYLVNLGLILPEVEGWGGGFHPGFQTHYRMGVELARFISKETGWPLLSVKY